jgi:hypothetical protein
MGRFSTKGVGVVCAVVLLGCGCKREEGISAYRAPKDPPAVAAAMEQGPADAGRGDQIAWTLPGGWRAVAVESIERARFAVNNEQPPLAVTVTSLNAGNDILANVNRWEGQLGLPASGPADLTKVVRDAQVDGEPAQLVDLNNPAPPARRTLGAIITHGDQKWFFKMSGPAEQVTAAAQDFGAFVGSVRFGAAKEMATTQAAEVTLAGFDTPPLWERDATTNEFRVLGFNIGEGEQRAQVTVARMSPQMTGGLLENLNRWRGQVGLEPISDVTAYKPTDVTVGGVRAVLFDITAVQGTANPARRLLVAVAGAGGNLWFFKISGPAGTVTAQEKAFGDFLTSVRWSNTEP